MSDCPICESPLTTETFCKACGFVLPAADPISDLEKKVVEAAMAMQPRSPWLDCPPCAKCTLPVAITNSREGARLPSNRLYCPSCGNEWEASAEHRQQAEKADAAWEIEDLRSRGGK